MRSGEYGVTLVVNGVEQPEQADGVVALGFGDEYVLRFRTFSGRRAVANVWIDSVKITNGGLIIPADRPADLETPPASPGSKFRFASVESQAAVAAGKSGPDTDGTKGLIRVEFQSEKAYQYTRVREEPVRRKMPTMPPMWGSGAMDSRRSFAAGGGEEYCRDTNISGSMLNASPPRGSSSTMGFGPDYAYPVTDSLVGSAEPKRLDSGVTVEGSKSSQLFKEEEFHVEGPVISVLLKLKGFMRESGVSRAMLSPLPQPQAAPCYRCGRPISVLSNVCPCGQRHR